MFGLLLVQCSQDPWVDSSPKEDDSMCFMTTLSTKGSLVNSTQSMTDMGVFGAYTGTNSWSAASTLNQMFNTPVSYNATTNQWNYTTTPSL
ncbi:MAG: hypothetical protein PHV49_06830 [Alistipes sp.]|nr:hypothetical protein [Alistipes sp.]